jgi:hypothetical protein
MSINVYNWLVSYLIFYTMCRNHVAVDFSHESTTPQGGDIHAHGPGPLERLALLYESSTHFYFRSCIAIPTLSEVLR